MPNDKVNSRRASDGVAGRENPLGDKVNSRRAPDGAAGREDPLGDFEAACACFREKNKLDCLGYNARLLLKALRQGLSAGGAAQAIEAAGTCAGLLDEAYTERLHKELVRCWKAERRKSRPI